MQILSLSIYNSEGERRDITFRPGKLNIITGATKTGKTAIIGIIDYCLGRNDYVVPAGIIRNNVTWYVLHLQLRKGQVVVGRPAPEGTTTSDVYLEVGNKLQLPDYNSLKRTTGSDQLVSFLGEQIGISDNEHVPPEGSTRLPLQVNLKHARFLLFQPQYRIMAPDLMFYRQQEEFVPQAIRDSLPYFLGATQDDQYAKLQDLRLTRRELRLHERRLADEESVRGRDASRALALVEQAQNLGLLDKGANTFEGAVDLLRTLQGWTPAREEAAPNSRLETLRQQREELLAEYKAIQGEIDAATSFTVAQDDYTGEVTDQSERLAAVGLYKATVKTNTCPLCESDLSAAIPTAEVINSSISELKQNIGAAYSQRPRLDEFISKRQERLSELRRTLSANKGTIEAIVEQEEHLREERNRLAEQARVAGRAGLFLESIVAASTEGGLQAGIRKLQEKVDRLERELSDDSVEDRLESYLRLISRWMTQWAERLEFEHAAWPLGFDLKHLTAISYRDERPERMSEIGGGSNWLICHLVTHFALQKWFINKKRPVPRFLVLDQPSQAYFPRERPFEGKVEDLEDKERDGVKRLFKFFYDVVQDLSPNLQVIVTDHADLTEEWFKEAVVENWHDGNALVPRNWYE